MSRRGLRDEEIERLLCEIPSDEDSTVDTTDDESDYEASIVAEAIVSSEGEVSESEEESESTPPKRAADTAPTWGQQFNATSGMQFDSESGPSAFIRDIDDPEPIDIFEKIFPKELVELIVFQTNLYATQSGKSFTPTTDNEIRTFLGINILMGIKRMPAYRDYWSSAPELHDRYIASLMAVNRFGWLLRNIHLNDNTLHPEKGHPGYDKLYKLRPVIKILSESFSKCYQPSKHLAIDESMIKFKGRNSMKQYMRDKPIKRGYKVWMLCDKTSYNLKFDIYTGKVGDTVQTGLGEHVVLSLSSELVNKGHYLYFDNYFNSYNLLAGLQQRNIYACGTVQPTRKHLPKLKTDKELSRDFNLNTPDGTGTLNAMRGIMCVTPHDALLPQKNVKKLNHRPSAQHVSEAGENDMQTFHRTQVGGLKAIKIEDLDIIAPAKGLGPALSPT
ncbi:piggyBac transposable element-derived protein 4-like [Schistocerca serialis cubense]|uniref:piggyBac transposable element-derived protein 4-like n=1 Tax=Schistocerca serialis cubense TaxID=2023355 RepID=UPI00214E0CC3|nr:piggyBac transposable element-derived protein 4-like [Schistocerca serialis cubense]